MFTNGVSRSNLRLRRHNKDRSIAATVLTSRSLLLSPGAEIELRLPRRLAKSRGVGQSPDWLSQALGKKQLATETTYVQAGRNHQSIAMLDNEVHDVTDIYLMLFQTMRTIHPWSSHDP